METRFVLLRRRRRDERELLALLQRVSVLLECGYDLAFAWRLCKKNEEGLSAQLAKLAKDFPVESQRPWFFGLSELYRAGGPILPYLSAWESYLIESFRSEVEEHTRTLPSRLNVILILFFLPPLFLLLFLPLLTAFSLGAL